MLTIRKDWATQPQDFVEVDPKWSLSALWSAASPDFDLISGLTATRVGNGLSLGVGVYGKKATSPKNGRTKFKAPVGTEAYTVFALVQDSGATRGAFRWPIESDTATRTFQLRFDANNQARFIVFSTDGSNAQATGTPASVDTGLTLIVGTVDANKAVKVYLNGAVGSTAPTAKATLRALTPATQLSIGTRVDGGDGFAGDIYLCGVANRAWSADEIKDLAASMPDSIFKIFAPSKTVILSASEPDPPPSPTRRRVGVKRQYQIKDKRYFLDEYELALKVNELLSETSRDDVFVVDDKNIKKISRRVWASLKTTSNKLEQFTKKHIQDELDKQIKQNILVIDDKDDLDDEELAILLL